MTNSKFTSRIAIISILIFGLLANSAALGASGGDDVILQKTYSGNVDYFATGASFRLDPNGVDACSFPTTPMSSTVNVDIPIGTNILDAYLYFAGSAELPSIDLSSQTLFLNNIPLNTSAGFNESDFTSLEDVVLAGIDFFGARRDVSNIVTGPGAYTFKGLEVSQTAFRTGNQTCLGAWALVVIYEDPSISQIRVINLFDGFQFYQLDTFDLQPRNFVVDNTAPAGKMTHISFEGDETLGTAGENFEFSADGITFTELIDLPNNPLNNQYNSTVTGPDFFFDKVDEWGLDVDTYDISTLLNPGDFEAVTRYNTGQDLVLLMAEVIQVDNKPLADIEIFLNNIGTFQANTSGSAQYIITAQNNGDGIVGSATAFAEGFIHVYNDLPTGISIDSLGDITSPGWDCSATNLSLDQIRCTYDLLTLAGGGLNPGDSLPDILITVDVAAPASPVTNIAYVTNCGADPDTCTTFAGKHQNSNQFDPINFFESTENLFDIVTKSSINNNVDAEITPIITGVPSNLSTSTKSVTDDNGGTLEPGDLLTYSITVTESSGTTDANNVSISDTLDFDTNGYNLQTNTCGGSDSFSLGVLTITGITVPAGTSCAVTFQVAVAVSANAGTSINNTADITSTNGVGATTTAPTLLVAGTATGSKILYFDGLGTAPILTREAPSSDTIVTLAAGASTALTLSPLLTSDLDINSGVIPVSIWIEASTTSGTLYSVTAALAYQSGTAIGSDTVNGVTMTNGIANAQLFPFQITLGSNITDLSTGEDITLTITNTSGSDITVHALLNGIDSKIVIDAEDVINVDSVSFFTDAARTNAVGSTIDAGETIYIEAIISDPFGFADITDARLTLIDPNLGNQLTNVAMTQDANLPGTKTYSYAYTIPDAASITPGIWVGQVTGFEGDEGTVTHTEVGNFETAAPEITVVYTVDKLTAAAGETLTYTVTVTNDGGATSLDISQLVPLGTSNVSVTNAAGGIDSSLGTNLDIANISAGTGTTTISFTVDILPGAQPGDLIDHTISLNNLGVTVQDIAPSVLISPFGLATGNKPIYADALDTVRRFDRTAPTVETTTAISSQGASRLFTLAPVLQSAITLDSGDITASIWISRGNTSFAGQRVIEATLGYNGAANGTISTDTVTIQLAGGAANAQYLPFSFNLASPLVLPANTSLTLTITNSTSITGENITVHSLRNTGGSDVPTLISLNVDTPLNITAIEYFTDSIDSAGVLITESKPNENIWVRATVSDPFGRDDITDATLVIEDPAGTETQASVSMIVPTTQPVSLAEKFFEYTYTLSNEQGDWITTVTAVEGNEGLVSETDTATINVGVSDLTSSFKFVSNTSTGNNSDNSDGDTLHYTIRLVNTGTAAAVFVDVTDDIPVNTTFVNATLLIDGVSAVPQPTTGTINLTGLTVPASSDVTIEFDVTINPGVTVGNLISNSAVITNPDGTTTSITVEAEDLLISGTPAAGTKLIYLENLNNAGAQFLTRSQPQNPDGTDFIFLDNAGGSVALDLDIPLRKAITIAPQVILVSLRMEAANQPNANTNRYMTVELGYQNGGTVTTIGSQARMVALTENNITTELFSFNILSDINIPEGNQLTLTVTNNHNGNRDVNLYSYDAGLVHSTIAFVPSPIINVDEITFLTNTVANGGTLLTNVDQSTATELYARVVISDPFGEADIQAPDAVTNPSVVSVISPNGSTISEDTNVACTAPCYAYVGEELPANDPTGNATRTFYYIIRLVAETNVNNLGTWTARVTANEGLEIGQISHIAANTFTTAAGSNLSTSTKNHDAVGDIELGDTFAYTITLNNTGGPADNVTFSDTLQTAPVELTFVSASTTCADENSASLPAPTFDPVSGDVTLSNISVASGGSCAVIINVAVGSATVADLINNTANIVNPTGIGATPVAPTIIYLQSQIPVAGSKQLYLDGLDTSTPILTRTQPTGSATAVTITGAGGSKVIDLAAATTRAMTLEAGSIEIALILSRSAGGANRQTRVELFVDPGTGSFQSIDSVQQNINLTTTPSKRTLNLTNATPIALGVDSIFRLLITNNTGNAARDLIVTSNSVSFSSQVVIPLTNPLEVDSVKFYDDSNANSGAEIINPALVLAGDSIWLRTVIADGFGAFDVNTGSQNCIGDPLVVDNCPTVTVTDPNGGSNVYNMTYSNQPNNSSRQYEFEVTPNGFGLDGIWQVAVTGTEGIEGVIFDTGVNTFERYQQPNLLIVKSAAGNTTPSSVLTFTTQTSHSDSVNGAAAFNVILTNTMGNFLELELTHDGVSLTWTALASLTAGFTVVSESFDDGDDSFTYNPDNDGICALPAAASPCYDAAIKNWRIELDEAFPLSTNEIVQTYKAKIQ